MKSSLLNLLFWGKVTTFQQVHSAELLLWVELNHAIIYLLVRECLLPGLCLHCHPVPRPADLMNTRRSPDLSASLKLSGVSLVSLDIWSRRQTESLLGCTTIAARLFLWVTTGRWRCGVNMFRLLRLEFERITCSVGHTRAFRPCLYIKPIRTNSRTCKQHLTARLIRYAHFQHSASSCTDPSYCFPADLGHRRFSNSH